MKIAPIQVMLLLDVLKDSLSIHGFFGLSSEDRTKLYNDIIRQQGNELVDLEEN